MLERFALVIHWIFFLNGVIGFFILANIFGEDNFIKGVYIGAIGLCGWTLLGWTIRYVLVDKIPFFPFMKKGETWRELFKRFDD